MGSQHLAASLAAVNWNSNVKHFLGHPTAAEQLEKAALRLAVWAKQFENLEKGNPALCFIREMQVASQQVACLAALAIYKASASAIRATLELALYYTYFRTHHAELATLVRDQTYYVDKTDLLEYHRRHTAEFAKLQHELGLIGDINKWYSDVSAVIHGQIPGLWISQKKLEDTAYNEQLLNLVVDTYCKGGELVQRLFLCTAGREIWGGISAPAKRVVMHGVSGHIKDILGLDAA